MSKTQVQIKAKPKRRVCKHPGRWLNRCKSCPKRG